MNTVAIINTESSLRGKKLPSSLSSRDFIFLTLLSRSPSQITLRVPRELHHLNNWFGERNNLYKPMDSLY